MKIAHPDIAMKIPRPRGDAVGVHDDGDGARHNEPRGEAIVKAAADRLRSNPHDCDAPAAVGTYLFAREQADKALDCFHRITRENPKYPGIWRLKAKAFEALGDAKNSDACRRRGADPRS